MHVRMYVCMCILIYVQDTYSEIAAHPQYPPPPPPTTDGAPLTLRLCPSVTSATKGGAPFLKYGAICLHSSACVESLSNACVLVEL